MYARYAESQGYKIEINDSNETEFGGFSLISFMIIGEGAYSKFKYESGAHRVQRVPRTEAQGRIHTSTATVLVMPEVDLGNTNIDMKDVTIEVYRASGAGGQHINKTESAVRAIHGPTGIIVACQDGRSQHANKEKALAILAAKVQDFYVSQVEEKVGAERRSKIGTGDRSEKIRTYNYPQNRVTDHRIGFTLNTLDRVMQGDIDKVIDAIEEREKRGSRFTILAVAEGAISKEDAKLSKKEYKEKMKNRKHPSVSYEIADVIAKRSGREVRVTVPGHTPRGGSPCPYDRVFASRLGSEAGKLILEGEYGFMVGIKNREIIKVPLEEVAGKLKMVSPDASIVKEAKMLGISFGD